MGQCCCGAREDGGGRGGRGGGPGSGVSSRRTTEEDPLLQDASSLRSSRSSVSERYGAPSEGYRLRAAQQPPPDLALASQYSLPGMSEEEAIQLAQRLTVIQQLPSSRHTGKHVRNATAEQRECLICMAEYKAGDEVRYLPCFHVYHKDCVDAWLRRSLTCPQCGETPLTPISGQLLLGGAEAPSIWSDEPPQDPGSWEQPQDLLSTWTDQVPQSEGGDGGGSGGGSFEANLIDFGDD